MFVFVFFRALKRAWWLASRATALLRAVSTAQVLVLTPLLLALTLLPLALFPLGPRAAGGERGAARPRPAHGSVGSGKSDSNRLAASEVTP
jgi:hypothetical protein